jgi:uncharacterized protein YidB (DUF937 family)
MSKGMPSLAALLGLVAVAGYQNRDKLGDLFKSITGGGAGTGGLLDSVKGAVGSVTAGNVTGGLGELVDQFKKGGLGSAADSWVGTGPNEAVKPSQLESALGSDMIDNLVKQTGLSRQDLLDRLASILPEAVDKLTPAGKLPA